MPDTADTQTTPPGEEQKPPPGVDSIVEPSGRTQADVRSAEEMLVQRLLGVDLRAENMNQPAEIARKIVERTSAILVNTRDHVSRLGGVLEREILANWVRGRNAMVGEPRPRNRAEAVMEAVRNTFPTEVVRELVERLWPTVYRADLRDHLIETKPNELVVETVELHRRTFDLVVDTDHPLWKMTDPKKIEDALIGKTFKDCGLRPIPDTHGRGYKITKNDAKKIIRTLSTQIYLLDTNAEDPTLNNHRGYVVRLKLRNLLAEQAETRQFNTVLQLRTFLSNAWVWNRYVEVIRTGRESGPTPDHTDPVAIPALTGKAFLLSGTLPLGIGRASLHNVASHQHALHRFRDPLLKGEVNPWDVATAMTMIEQQGHLTDALQPAFEKKDAIQNASRQLQLVRLLGRLPEMKALQLSIVAPRNWSLKELEMEVENINHDLADLSRARKVGQRFGRTPTSLHGQQLGITQHVSGATARHYAESLGRRLKEAEAALTSLKEVGHSLVEIHSLMSGIEGMNPGICTRLMDVLRTVGTATEPHPDNLNLMVSLQSIVGQINEECNLRDEQHYRDELKKLQEESGKKLEGAEGIHAIYKAYFKGKNLSEREALNAANALMSRNACDAQMEEVIRDFTEAAHPVQKNADFWDYEMGSTPFERLVHGFKGLTFSKRRIRGVVNTVAAALALPLTGSGGSRRIAYEQVHTSDQKVRLAQAYFALKSLKGAARRIGLPEYDAEIDRFLRELGGYLARHCARSLLYMFKGRLPGDFGQDDKAIETVLGQPEKLKAILRELLAGEAPEAHKAAIEKALARAEHEFEFWRRTLLIDRFVGEKWSVRKAITSETNPLSLRNIYFGRWGIFGLPWRILKWGGGVTKATPGAVWKERKPIALGALLGTLFLPGVGTAIGAAVGGAYRKVMQE